MKNDKKELIFDALEQLMSRMAYKDISVDTIAKQAGIGKGSIYYYFESKDGLDDFLLNKCLQNSDIVLIKGARYSSKLYQVTDSLLAKGK